MRIDVPDLKVILPQMLEAESSFEGEINSIDEWVQRQRCDIDHHLELVKNPSEENDIEILLSFLQNILVRAMTGEAGNRTHQALKQTIRSKSDLHADAYAEALRIANYRWGVETGSRVISEVVEYFSGGLGWRWQAYFDAAKEQRHTNFLTDHLLSIKGVGFKVRDLALSMFDPNYAAFDLHVARVPTRIGLLNYGFELLGDPKIEMGNNPADNKNYLFLHKLFIRLSELTDSEFLPVDFDRIFWHFGRTYCKAKPKCSVCPIKDYCLMGRLKQPVTQSVAQPSTQKIMEAKGNLNGQRVSLRYGGSGDAITVDELIHFIQDSGRDYIIIGGANVPLGAHTKPQSLDYWIRQNHTQRPGTRQAVASVVDALIATGRFEKRGGLACPDSGYRCNGIVLIPKATNDG